MAGKSKILVIGGTGYIGKFIVEASAAAGHPTFVLIRESTLSNPQKSQLIQSFRNSGVNFIPGDIYDEESLVKAIREVDVVISTVGYAQMNDQDRILAAIKEAGNVKFLFTVFFEVGDIRGREGSNPSLSSLWRFFPSEFGNDVDRVHDVEPATSMFQNKAKFRRVVEAAGVPYTFVSSNFFAGMYLRTLAQLGATDPPRDEVVIFGDGNAKAVYNKEEDIATYTIKAVDDSRTANKILYVRPGANCISTNELTTLWENKIGKKLHRTYVPEEQLLKDIHEASAHLKVKLGIFHSVFVKGDQTNFDIEASFGVEASELYPDVKFATVDQMLDQYV